jgi:hypothetical protein
MLARRVFVLLALLGVGVLQAAPMCTIGTLASYEALGAGGCMDGDLVVKDFAFSVLTSGGGAIPVLDTAITLTPTNSAPSAFGLKIASAGFSVTGTGFVKYLIAYTWDPHNIRSMDDLLDIAVSPPGLVKVTTDGCVGAAFSGAICSMSINTVTVSDDGITPVLSNSVTFSPALVPVLGIRNTIDLEGNTTGSASFDSFSNEASAPEPATWMSAGACLCAFLLCRRCRRPHARLKAGQPTLDGLS